MLLSHPTPTAILNSDFIYEYCNEAYSNTLGFSKEFLLEKHISEQLTDCDNARKPLSWRFIKIKEHFFNIKITPIEKEQKPIQYYVILSQIDAKTDLYKRLERDEKIFYSVYLNSKIGIALLDNMGNILMTNNALEVFVGYSEKELQTKNKRLIQTVN